MIRADFSFRVDLGLGRTFWSILENGEELLCPDEGYWCLKEKKHMYFEKLETKFQPRALMKLNL